MGWDPVQDKGRIVSFAWVILLPHGNEPLHGAEGKEDHQGALRTPGTELNVQTWLYAFDKGREALMSGRAAIKRCGGRAYPRGMNTFSGCKNAPAGRTVQGR